MNQLAITHREVKDYETLVEECHAIKVERIYRANQEFIQGYAEIGERICKDPLYKKYGNGNSDFLSLLFKDIGLGNRTGRYCIQFYQDFVQKPKLENIEDALHELPEGKNINWHTLCHKYLDKKDGKTKEDCKHQWAEQRKCLVCGITEDL